MPIKFRCEHCRQLLGISQSKAGEVVDCPTCGRAVRVPSLDGKADPVPVPQMNLNDSELANALNALASLGQVEQPSEADSESEPSAEPVSPDSSEELSEAAPAPVPLPEVVDLPPLEKPIAILEPAAIRDRLRLPGSEASEKTQQERRDALADLAQLADRPAREPQRHETQSLSMSQGKSNFGAMLLIAAVSFLAGFLVHAQFFSPVVTEQTDSQNDPASAAGGNDAVSKPAETSQFESRKSAVEGRITFRTPDGNSRPDAGATVILLPTQRSSSAKLPIVGFRPADHQEDREIARASVRALGGDVAIVDQEGNFSAELAESGEYYILVLSHFQAREEDEVRLPPEIKTILASYFDRPEQLPGRLRYHLGQIRYRGEASETWDYSFERS